MSNNVKVRRAIDNPDVRLAAAVFVCCWGILAATAPGIPMVWDEHEYIVRARNIVEWFRAFPGALSQEQLRTYWLFIHYAEGHPAGFALPIAFGQWIFWDFDLLTASRLGPITVFSSACAAVALRLRHTHGMVAAIAAPVTLLTLPRLFSEAHFATQDGQLTAWWLLLWVIQSTSAGGWRATVGLGLVLGMTTATKFTGWLAWLPFAMSQVIQRNAAALRRLAIALPVAFLTFYIVNPPIWHEPLDGLREHFHRNLDRANTLNISTQFLGRMYNVTNPLPWYNTIVWLVFATPVPTLLFGVVGLWRCLYRPTPLSVSLVIHWATLMIVRALPGTPPHDGIRLFLPAFGFWCALAAIGVQWVFDRIAIVPTVHWRTVLRLAVAGMLAASAVNLFRYYPQTLSHYSLLAGGLRGAADKGMEPTYWWDALDADVLRWLNEHTGPGEAVAFSTVFNLGHLRESGRLRPETVDPATARFKWFVLQNRPGMFSATDRYLMRRQTPAYVKYAGRRRSGAAVAPDLDVPLIAVFSSEQFERARRRSR